MNQWMNQWINEWTQLFWKITHRWHLCAPRQTQLACQSWACGPFGIWLKPLCHSLWHHAMLSLSLQISHHWAEISISQSSFLTGGQGKETHGKWLSSPLALGQNWSPAPTYSLPWICWQKLVTWQHLLLSGTKTAHPCPVPAGQQTKVANTKK